MRTSGPFHVKHHVSPAGREDYETPGASLEQTNVALSANAAAACRTAVSTGRRRTRRRTNTPFHVKHPGAASRGGPNRAGSDPDITTTSSAYPLAT